MIGSIPYHRRAITLFKVKLGPAGTIRPADPLGTYLINRWCLSCAATLDFSFISLDALTRLNHRPIFFGWAGGIRTHDFESRD